MLFAVPAISRTPAGPSTVPPDLPPPPITSIVLGATRVDWTGYAAPADFAGYDVRFTTVAGQSWAAATDLAAGLQIASSVALSAFPAAAVECLVAPVDAAGLYGFPAARCALSTVVIPAPISVISLLADRVAWTYTPGPEFAGYDVRYTTVAGGAWASAIRLSATLQPAGQAFALLSAFPAAAVECLVAPVSTTGGTGLPPARSGLVVQPPGTGRDDPTKWAVLRTNAAAATAGLVTTIASNADLSRLNPATPGRYYVFTYNPTVDFIVSGAGTITNPIVLTSDTDTNIPSNFRVLDSLTCQIKNASHVYLRRLALTGSPGNPHGSVQIGATSNRISVERCASWGQGWFNDPLGEVVVMVAVTGVTNWRVRYCTHGKSGTNTGGLLTRMHTFPADGVGASTHGYIYRNEVNWITHNLALVGVFYTMNLCMLGDGYSDLNSSTFVSIYENYVHDCGGQHSGECVEFKTSDNLVFDNTVERGAGGAPMQLRGRNGNRNKFYGNLGVHPLTDSTPALEIQIRGLNNEIYNNWDVKLATGAQPTTAAAPAGGAIKLWGGNTDCYHMVENRLFIIATLGINAPSQRGQAALAQAGGNRMTVRLGDLNGDGNYGYGYLGATLCRVGPLASLSTRKDRNGGYLVSNPAGDSDYVGRGQLLSGYRSGGVWTGGYGNPIGGSSTTRTTTLVDADYDAVPTRLFSTDVGVDAPAAP